MGLLPIAIAWNLSGLACILLKAKNAIRDLLSSSRDSITVSSVLSDFNDSALNKLKSYLSDRKQCVKLGQFSTQMLEIYKGVPQ
jgi:L-aminopeptidase/D-esterase-like protein